MSAKYWKEIQELEQLKRDIKVSSTPFSEMCNLRILKINVDNIGRNRCKLHLPKGLDSYLSSELRYFQWDFYPLKSLPSDFTPEKLVELTLRRSNLKQLGNYVVQFLPKLRRIDLNYSKLLNKIPDLSRSPNIEWIKLEGCTSLLEILSSIQNLQHLTILNLKGCTNVRDLEGIILLNHGDTKNMLNNISHLSFTSFKRYISTTLMVPRAHISLKFPMNIKFLRLAGTDIEVVSSSIDCLSKFYLLDLRGCKKLKSVPTSICKLKCLRVMDLAECSKLKEFPEISEPMESLEILELSGAGIKKLPESIGKRIALIKITCSKLEKFPDLFPSSLQLITYSNCERLKSATYRPSNIGARGLNLAVDSSSLDLNTHDYVANHPALLCCIVPCNSYCKRRLILLIGYELINFPAMLQTLDGENVESCYQGDEVPKQFSYQSLGSSIRDEVPKQFSYQSLGSSISVTLPPNWTNNRLLGVGFCIVFHRSVIDPNTLVWICYSIDHGQPNPISEARYVDLAMAAVENYPDTVLTGYGSKIENGKNWFCKPVDAVTNVTYRAWPMFIDRRDWLRKDLGSEYCEIKKCGIRLAYMDFLEEYANFYAYLEASGNADESLATVLLGKMELKIGPVYLIWISNRKTGAFY
ncbi:hypothetical protein FNV43_RR10068 [Rhamnella rubrinervis]|uniref:C-JID domain-containing protein n=1 Tax=Rhamnella rubrinervis TaxID=2594499 RepID=A0A8K0HCF9_9ROSA|nr:hypothetical protein FNV43_RR10068 [Rhamnella rubrinervis]